MSETETMSTVRVLDEGGDGVTFMEHEGQLLPRGNISAYCNLRNVAIRSDDIIIAAYPKAGTHWVSEIIHILLSHSLEASEFSKIQRMMESTPEEEYKNLPSPRILNTHLYLQQLPVDLVSKKAKIVFLVRNPRDVAVSYYNFLRVLPFCNYSGKWRNFYRPFYQGKFCYGSLLDHTLHWEEIKKTHPDLPILTLQYEDIKEHPVREALRMCDFLEIERDERFVQQVCERCAFESLKKLKGEGESYAFRKGQVGDWKNWFTVAQNEWFEQFYAEKMKDCLLKFRYALD